jgi:Glycine rich protein
LRGRLRLSAESRLIPAIVTAIVVLAGGVRTSQALGAAFPAACTQSGQTVTCTYTSGSNPISVPVGVSSIRVSAVGGMGGDFTECTAPGVCSPDVAGGFGATVSGDLSASPGSTVYAIVGANGTSGTGPGGSGAGGGASDVRTSQNNPSTRLLVAAGGGGAGGSGLIVFGVDQMPGGSGGPGGAAGANGTPGAAAPWPSVAAGAGGGATSTAGGAGGPGGIVTSISNCSPACVGVAGTAGGVGAGGLGGSGGDVGEVGHVSLEGGPGGGGGGGLFGGGGGGGGSPAAGGAGGGGGSNLVPLGGTQAVDTTGVPMVQISYTASKDPTSTAVNCSRARVKRRRGAKCTATVTDTTAGSPPAPTGTVAFFSSGSGSFVKARHCVLAGASGASTSCSVKFRLRRRGAGPLMITSRYSGDSEHRASVGTTVVRFHRSQPRTRW